MRYTKRRPLSQEEEDYGEESKHNDADDNDLASGSECDNCDVVLQEIGYSSGEDEQTYDETEGETEHLRTRAGRHATNSRSRQFFGMTPTITQTEVRWTSYH